MYDVADVAVVRLARSGVYVGRKAYARVGASWGGRAKMKFMSLVETESKSLVVTHK